MSSDQADTKVSAADSPATEQKSHWAALSKDHVLSRFGSELKSILDDASYDEMYGVKLVAPDEGYVDPTWA